MYSVTFFYLTTVTLHHVFFKIFLIFLFLSIGKTQTVGERAALKFGRYMWGIVVHWPGFIYVKLRGWARTTKHPY